MFHNLLKREIFLIGRIYMKHKTGIWLAMLALMLTLAGCGAPKSVPSELVSIKEQVRAVEGSTMASTNNRVSLEIPAGALPEDTEISISEVAEDEWPEAIRELEPEGKVLRLDPNGLEFSEPATIKFRIDPDGIEGTESENGLPAYTLVSMSKDGEQEYLDDTETHIFSDGSIEVSGKLSHFSWIVRNKSYLLVKLDQQEKEREVDEKFRVQVRFYNEAPEGFLSREIAPKAQFEARGPIEIEERNDFWYGLGERRPSRTPI
jgi:hypothetical protein